MYVCMYVIIMHCIAANPRELKNRSRGRGSRGARLHRLLPESSGLFRVFFLTSSITCEVSEDRREDILLPMGGKGLVSDLMLLM